MTEEAFRKPKKKGSQTTPFFSIVAGVGLEPTASGL